MDDICVYVVNHKKWKGAHFRLPANVEEICEKLEAVSWEECSIFGSDLPMDFNEDAELSYVNQQYQAFMELSETPLGEAEIIEKFIKRLCVKDIAELAARRDEIRFYAGCENIADVAYKRTMFEYPVLKELPDSLIKYFSFWALGYDMEKKWRYIAAYDGMFEIRK